MRVEVLSLCLVAAAISYFFPAKVQAMSSCTHNGALKQKQKQKQKQKKNPMMVIVDVKN